MNALSIEGISAALETAWVGQQMLFFPSVGSTNDEAMRLAEAGAPEGTLVIADFQTAGRGRLDRQWWSPPGSSLLLSLVFRPSFLAPHQAQRLTMVCSLAVCDAVEQVTNLMPVLKWPNDVLIDGRKICGLLSELGVVNACLDYVVVGLGINVNVDFGHGDMPESMTSATSLEAAVGHEVSRLSVLAALLRCVEVRYERLRAGVLPRDEWQSRLDTLGREVRVTMPGQTLNGLATGVDADGALLMQLADGRTVRVLAGDVTLRG